uniref:DNA gyrase subunit A n=1 Tax=uncultured Methylobacterium sp. TaxID=157278 RepID=UPI0035CA1BFE
IDSADSIAEAYRTGRGAFRVRARWAKEDLGRGTWTIVVTEIPYGIPKARLIEKLAELLQDKKLPLLADVRDESAEDVRVVLEPRSRSVDPVILMESLFRLTELEARIPLNMNVLVGGLVPRVIGLAEALREWLDHRRVVLQRRSRHRLAQIERRLEILGGLLIVYLDLDEVIRIIREEDEPKPSLMKRFELTELQANAILDTRLRSLRRLEEMELKRELSALTTEKDEIEALLGSEPAQWKSITQQIRAVKKTFGPETKVGRRRTTLEDPPDTTGIDFTSAMVEREPITVIVSTKGWIRALKGHVTDLSGVAFRGDDALRLSFLTETTAKILVLASDGKVFTLEAAKLPGGRGFGDPIRLMVDFDDGTEIVAALPYQPGGKLLLAATDGRGFLAPADSLIANTRKGKGVVGLDDPAKAALLVPAQGGDHVAVCSADRLLLVFPISEMPELVRGKGVRLQRCRQSTLSDAYVFTLSEGLPWRDSAGQVRLANAALLERWMGHRADAGTLMTRSFPKFERFGK